MRNGSVLNHYRGAFGILVSVSIEEKIDAVWASVVEDPNKSYRKRAQASVMKPSSMLTKLERDLKLTPYKMHNVQQVSLADEAARMEMWFRFQEKKDNDDTWINNVWFSD